MYRQRIMAIGTGQVNSQHTLAEALPLQGMVGSSYWQGALAEWLGTI